MRVGIWFWSSVTFILLVDMGTVVEPGWFLLFTTIGSDFILISGKQRYYCFEEKGEEGRGGEGRGGEGRIVAPHFQRLLCHPFV